jgi:hypothetical protein
MQRKWFWHNHHHCTLTLETELLLTTTKYCYSILQLCTSVMSSFCSRGLWCFKNTGITQSEKIKKTYACLHILCLCNSFCRLLHGTTLLHSHIQTDVHITLDHTYFLPHSWVTFWYPKLLQTSIILTKKFPIGKLSAHAMYWVEQKVFAFSKRWRKHKLYCHLFKPFWCLSCHYINYASNGN